MDGSPQSADGKVAVPTGDSVGLKEDATSPGSPATQAGPDQEVAAHSELKDPGPLNTKKVLTQGSYASSQVGLLLSKYARIRSDLRVALRSDSSVDRHAYAERVADYLRQAKEELEGSRPNLPVAASLLICAGTPGQSRVRVDGRPAPRWWPGAIDPQSGPGGAPAAQRGRTTLTPTRAVAGSGQPGQVPGQRIVTTPRQAAGSGAMTARARGRPALSWSAGRWPGDVMIDGVSHRVRPLVLSGPASVAWRQETCGSRPRCISGVGSARTSRIAHATCPSCGMSDGGA
jgi:hypothetical protein